MAPIADVGYAAKSATTLELWEYEIRDLKSNDVLIEVAFCGICHSDIHTARSEWGETIYPVVPGHEFTGHIKEIGSSVKKFKIGDRVAVGCLIGSCRSCSSCKKDLENYCDDYIFTYNSIGEDGSPTQGGYSKYVVGPEDFVLRLPDNLPMDRAAPLMCAGITTYSPLVRCGLKEGGRKVGVVGLGGLGHMAVQFASKFGNEVVVLSRSASKSELAVELGASRLLSTPEQYVAERGTFDVIIDTVSAAKLMAPYLKMLAVDGTLIMVGLPPAGQDPQLDTFSLIMKRRSVMGSVIGGIKETQEMLDYCAEMNILPYIEKITCDQINEAYERVIRSDVKFRFVIDINASCL